MFNFTPLLGALSSSPASQSLLEFEGGVKVLIDLGWDETFDVAQLKSLERHVSSLSLILLTHPTPAHIAAFAHCCKHFPLFTQIPIYATTPVISLGRTLLQDIYSSTPLASTIIPQTSLSEGSYSYSSTSLGESLQLLLQPPTLDEIASYFSLINPLKYSQSHQPIPSPFSPPLNGLTITAYNAGHTLGGTIWHIQHGMESVVYAVDWNQVRENVLGGAAWLGGSGAGGAEVIEQLRKPTALICSTKGAERNPLAGGRTKRDDLLVDMIRTSIAKGGIVLIPTDSSARVLELAYLLDHAWRKESNNANSPFQKAKLYFASKTADATMRYAASMLEWMDENVVREFETSTANTSQHQHTRTTSKQLNEQERAGKDSRPSEKLDGPFEFKHLKLVQRKSQMERLLMIESPMVILASDSSLEWGFSKDFLVKIAKDPANLIILTRDYGIAGAEHDEHVLSLGSTVWGWYQERKDGVAMETGSDGQHLEQVHTNGRIIDIHYAQQVALEGKEIQIHQQYLASQRQFQNALQTSTGINLESSADAIDETSSTSSSSTDQSDPERQGKALNISTTIAHANRNKMGVNKEIVGVNALLHQPGLYDYDVRGKKGRESLFPFTTKRRRGDDFGDLIRPEDYLRAEERDEVNGQDMRGTESDKDTRLGQKRRWENSGQSNGNGRRGSQGSAKRRKSGNPHEGDGPTKGNGEQKNLQAQNVGDVSEDSETDAEEVPLGPSKLVIQKSKVQVSLRIAFVDFAGMHDQRSLTMLIPLIQPRKVVFVGGTVSETKWLAEDYRQKLKSRSGIADEHFTEDVFCPIVGETVSASMDTNAWTVKLSEALVRRLRWQSVRGLEVVTLMGRLTASSEPDQGTTEVPKPKRQKLLKGEAEGPTLNETPQAIDSSIEPIPVLDVLPASMIAATRSVTQPLHVGDLRLADLRKLLQSTGYTAEFRGEGTLLIDDLVAIKKSSTGQIEVESGGLHLSGSRSREYDDSFHTVKRKIYDGLAVIAGG